MAKEHVEQLGFSVAGFEPVDDFEPKIYSAEEIKQIRLNHEIKATVREINARLGEEPFTGEVVTLIPINFTPESDQKGKIALYYANNFLSKTEDETAWLIRPRTQQILDELSIPYQIVSPTGNGES